MRSEQCSDLPVHASLFSEIRFCVMSLIIGTAGWSIPAKDSSSFPQGGSNLQRYAARFRGVEVNRPSIARIGGQRGNAGRRACRRTFDLP
jgi:hypothetical protein